MNILEQDAGLPKQSIAGLTDDLTWLPAVDPDHVDILNMFRRHAVPVQLNICGLSGTLSIADRACALVETVFAIPLSVGPWAGKLVLPAGTLQPLCSVVVWSEMSPTSHRFNAVSFLNIYWLGH